MVFGKIQKQFSPSITATKIWFFEKPKTKPVLGIKIGMFSAMSGNIMWSSDAVFDSSEASVIKLVKSYYKEHYQRKQSLYDWKIILLSMKRYAQFVAHHMVNTL